MYSGGSIELLDSTELMIDSIDQSQLFNQIGEVSNEQFLSHLIKKLALSFSLLYFLLIIVVLDPL